MYHTDYDDIDNNDHDYSMGNSMGKIKSITTSASVSSLVLVSFCNLQCHMVENQDPS